MSDGLKSDSEEALNSNQVPEDQVPENEIADVEVSSEEDTVERPITVSASHDPKERKELMLKPTLLNEWQCCYLDRIRLGVTKFDRKYALYAADGTLFATCQKRKKNKTPHYVVSTDPHATAVDRDHPHFVGKIRSNFMGSEFSVFDMGKNPKKLNKSSSTLTKDSSGIPIREELAHITYTNSLLSKGRKMKVVVPKVSNDVGNPDDVSRPEKDADNLKLLSAGRSGTSAVTTFVNKPGRWSPTEKCYRINWVHTRAPLLSRRNFQLARSEDLDDVVLQFGKGPGNRYFLDFRAGISPFQAMAIAISMMDYKYCTA